MPRTYTRQRRGGGRGHEVVADPRVYVRRDPLDRLMERVVIDSDTGCWIAPPSKDGYARISLGGHQGEKVLAHHLTYERHVGPIPVGADLHHRCETPACCNPSHLEPLTSAEHSDRHRPVFCKRGHDNWRVRPNGQRDCRTCHADRERERRAKAR